MVDNFYINTRFFYISLTNFQNEKRNKNAVHAWRISNLKNKLSQIPKSPFILFLHFITNAGLWILRHDKYNTINAFINDLK